MSQYETVDRIRRSHRAARPNPAENPAWANCHMDCGVLLAEIDRLREALEEIRGIKLLTDCGIHPMRAAGIRHAFEITAEIAAKALAAEHSTDFKKCPNCGSAYGDLARCACGRLPDNQYEKP